MINLDLTHRAWVFAAALILGFSMFSDPETSFVTLETFNFAMEILEEESGISPHAKQYHGILKDISTVIRQRYDQILNERRRSNWDYVARVLQCDGHDPKDEPAGEVPPPETNTRSHQDPWSFDEMAEDFSAAWDDAGMVSWLNAFSPPQLRFNENE